MNGRENAVLEAGSAPGVVALGGGAASDTDALLEVDLSYRDVPEDAHVGLPLVTLCWRALKRGAAAREQERREIAAAIRQLEDTAGRVLSELARARRLLAASGGDESAGRPAAVNRGLDLAFTQMEEALSGCGVRRIAPAGVAYEGELLETFQNVAQEERPGLARPVIKEVLTAAIMIHDRLFQAGEAVISVPAQCAGPEPEVATGGSLASERNDAETLEGGKERALRG